MSGIFSENEKSLTVSARQTIGEKVNQDKVDEIVPIMQKTVKKVVYVEMYFYCVFPCSCENRNYLEHKFDLTPCHNVASYYVK